MSNDSSHIRGKARELLIRSKIYRVLALVFLAVGGMIVFAVYMKRIDGQVLSEALLDPITWLLLFLPLIPAAVLEWKSRKNRAAFDDMTQGKS